jgi:hypothetical protein
MNLMTIMEPFSTSPSTTRAASNSSSSHIRQEEIDRLRSRVDNVLKTLIKSAETDSVSLRTQVRALRDGPTVEGEILGDDKVLLLAPQDDDRSCSILDDKEQTSGADPTSTVAETITKTTGKWVVDPYGDQGEFEGELNGDNLPNGYGIMKYSDGRIYDGEWQNGRWHGVGQATFSNGDTYDGMYYEDQRHGQGIYKWNDGRMYNGGFVNDQRSGHGEYTWPDGAKYQGDFEKGLRHGEGTYTVSEPIVYLSV